MQKPEVTLLFLTVKSPFFVGIYADNILVDSLSVEGKASDSLPLVVGDLLEKYEPVAMIYANGPGNQMSIKITYVVLKSISIVKNIPLMAASSFEFNNFGHIELANKRFFCFENDNITLKHLPEGMESAILLPKNIASLSLSDKCEPLYILPPA